MYKVWEAELDGKYDVYVVADGENVTLKLELDGKVLAEQPTALSYGAIFGPDISDVDDWMEWAIDVVDNHRWTQ